MHTLQHTPILFLDLIARAEIQGSGYARLHLSTVSLGYADRFFLHSSCTIIKEKVAWLRELTVPVVPCIGLRQWLVWHSQPVGLERAPKAR